MRQRIHSILALAGLLTIGACATLNSERSVAQQQALTRLGFVEVNEGWELNLGRRLSFAVDESTLNADAYAMVKEIAQVLLAVGVEQLTVDGHADNSGSKEYNWQISELRAESVARALAENGFALNQIKRRAYGAAMPIAENTSEAGRQANRRAVLIVPSR